MFIIYSLLLIYSFVVDLNYFEAKERNYFYRGFNVTKRGM